MICIFGVLLCLVFRFWRWWLCFLLWSFLVVFLFLVGLFWEWGIWVLFKGLEFRRKVMGGLYLGEK